MLLVERERAQEVERYAAMSAVGGIETAAKQPDSTPRARQSALPRNLSFLYNGLPDSALEYSKPLGILDFVSASKIDPLKDCIKTTRPIDASTRGFCGNRDSIS